MIRRKFLKFLMATPLALVGLRTAKAVQPPETWEPQVGREQDIPLQVPSTITCTPAGPIYWYRYEFVNSQTGRACIPHVYRIPGEAV